MTLKTTRQEADRDPFLLAHRLAPLTYSTGPPLTPFSLRDQIVRATLIVGRLAELGLLNRTRPLLSIGGGAAGVSGSLEAVRHGVHATLSVREERPFARFRHCTTRWVCPTLFDWPSPRWDHGALPIEGKALPLSFTAGIISTIVENWDHAIDQAESTGLLDVRTESRLAPGFSLPTRPVQNAGQPYLEIALTKKPSDRYGAVLFAPGWGDERTPAAYRGYKYWQTDCFDREEHVAALRNVLITGAGDAGLQDFLRLNLRQYQKGMKVLLRGLRSLFAKMPSPYRLANILELEDRTSRLYAWSASRHEHIIELDTHRWYLTLAEALWDRHAKALEELFAKVLRDPIPQIRIAHSCNHFTRAASPNHLLALLVSRYRTGTVTGSWLQDCSPSIDACTCPERSDKAPACHGTPHTVRFVARACDGQVPTNHPPEPEQFDAILVRQGIQQHAETPTLPGPLQIHRHLLPYCILETSTTSR